jgi:two-component system, sensor histidine kinase
LRNPLAPIQNGMYLLQTLDGGDPASKERARSVLTIVDRQVAHLVRLVDDLLESARITTGKIELRKEYVDLSTVILQALQMSEPLIQVGKHKISVSLDDQPLIVEGDPVRLTQVFANLLNNAAKYTPPEGQIEMSTKRDGDQASVSVRDNGIGIDADALPGVFDLFTQSSQARSGMQGGIGVGLALVRRLVEMHGGQVVGRSEGVGCGSEFVVRLALAVNSSSAVKAEKEMMVSSIPATRRVLVVDDERDVADILAMLLQELGWDVRIAYSGAAGLAAISEFKPQLAFVDIGMSGMDGYETAQRIRMLPEGKKLVLTALSGWGQKDDRRRAIEAGFDHHFMKPIGIDALKKLLESLPVKP